MTIDEQIEILKAVKEGKKIEVSADDGQTWHPKDGHEFNFGVCLYRIVREPRRFIVYEWRGKTYAVPYDNNVPDDAKIICTATEDAQVEIADLADLAEWAEDEAKKLVARAKTVGTEIAG